MSTTSSNNSMQHRRLHPGGGTKGRSTGGFLRLLIVVFVSFYCGRMSKVHDALLFHDGTSSSYCDEYHHRKDFNQARRPEEEAARKKIDCDDRSTATKLHQQQIQTSPSSRQLVSEEILEQRSSEQHIQEEEHKKSTKSTKMVVDLLPHLRDCEIGDVNEDGKPLLSLSELAQIYKPTKFVGFYHTNYDRIYPQYLEQYRMKKFKMLEIGLDTGEGSKLWQHYFPCAQIYGLEYAAGKTKTDGATRIYKTIQGDQGDANYLRSARFLQNATDGGDFDLIIDDGGHHYEQQTTSYQVLFHRALKPGGIYIVEDIETSYWESGTKLYGKIVTRGGCTGSERTAINQFKQLVDVVNKKFIDYHHSIFGEVDYWVSTVTFMSNLIILTKKDKSHCNAEHPYEWPHSLSRTCPAKYQSLDRNILMKVAPSLVEYCK